MTAVCSKWIGVWRVRPCVCVDIEGYDEYMLSVQTWTRNLKIRASEFVYIYDFNFIFELKRSDGRASLHFIYAASYTVRNRVERIKRQQHPMSQRRHIHFCLPLSLSLALPLFRIHVLTFFYRRHEKNVTKLVVFVHIFQWARDDRGKKWKKTLELTPRHSFRSSRRYCVCVYSMNVTSSYHFLHICIARHNLFHILRFAETIRSFDAHSQFTAIDYSVNICGRRERREN